MKYSDVNQNGILDSHEKWFLGVKIIVFSWSLFFLTWSYIGNTNIDRLFVSSTLTASALGSFQRKKPK
jgi:O-antigen/teichoic acid export membrane protein